MIAIAKNLGEKPICYGELITNDDGTVSVLTDKGFASQQPTAGHPYEAAYGLFQYVPQKGPWEKAEKNGLVVTFSVNGERFGYVAY